MVSLEAHILQISFCFICNTFSLWVIIVIIERNRSSTEKKCVILTWSLQHGKRTVSFLVLNTGIATVVIRTGPWPSSSWTSHKRRSGMCRNWKSIKIERELGKEKRKIISRNCCNNKWNVLAQHTEWHHAYYMKLVSCKVSFFLFSF